MTKPIPPPTDCLCELIQRGEELSQEQATLRAAIAEEEATLKQAKKKARKLRNKLNRPL